MCSGSLPTNSIFPIPPLFIPAPQLNKCHIWSLERAKKKIVVGDMETDRVWYRPKFNIPFFLHLASIVLFAWHAWSSQLFHVFSFFFLKIIFFCLCSLNYSHGYGPIVWMKDWPSHQPMTSYVIFLFLSCYLALDQMHGTLPYYLFSSWIIIIISVTF